MPGARGHRPSGGASTSGTRKAGAEEGPRSSSSNPPRSDTRTRRAILEWLKWDGPQDARTLAGRLEVSAMAVRQHLYALQKEKMVAAEEQQIRQNPMARTTVMLQKVFGALKK